MTPEFTSFYHLQLHNIGSEEALKFCKEYLTNRQYQQKCSIFFMNTHCFNLSLKDKEYFNAINNCDFLLNDGVGINLAAKLIGVNIKENMNGTDFIPKVLNLANQLNKSVFLLGAKSGVAERAKINFSAKYPELDISGVEPGYFNNDIDIIDKINGTSAELLIVGMGVPLQEKWVSDNLKHLKNIKLSIAGGAILDFSAGNVKRAPVFLQKIGMEWCFRLTKEPVRLFRRYCIGNVQFLKNIICWNIKKIAGDR